VRTWDEHYALRDGPAIPVKMVAIILSRRQLVGSSSTSLF